MSDDVIMQETGGAEPEFQDRQERRLLDETDRIGVVAATALDLEYFKGLNLKESPNESKNFVVEAHPAMGQAERDKLMETAVEILEMHKQYRERGEKMEGRCVIVLRPDLDSSARNDEPPNLKRILGEGSCGKVQLVTDTETRKDYAQKTFMLTDFKGDEIWAWIHVMGKKMAPELYSFKLQDGKVFVNMEPLKGKTLTEIARMMRAQKDELAAEDPMLAAYISLSVLIDLLEIYKHLHENYIHLDTHLNNVVMLQTMDVRLLDFGTAKKLVCLDPYDGGEGIKKDIIGIILIFCSIYSGRIVTIDSDKLKDILEVKNLTQLNEFMVALTEDQRKQLYQIIEMLFDTVRDVRQEKFGDTSHFRAYAKGLLPEDNEELKKKAAAIIFPEFQHKMESDPSLEFEMESEIESDKDDYYHPIWDDPDLDVYVQNVTEEDLKRLSIRLRK